MVMSDISSVHERFLELLPAAGVSFRQVHHEPTPTSEDARAPRRADRLRG